MKRLTPVPSEKYNIDEFRRRKKTKKLFKRGLLVLLCLLLAIGIYFMIQSLQQHQTDRTTAAVDSFPISLRGENPTDLLGANNEIVVVGDNKLLYYTPAATKKQDLAHGMAKPMMVNLDSRILTYDQNGTSWRVDAKGKNMKEGKTDNGILLGRLGAQNMTALVTFEDRFNTSLIIYNKNFEQIYKYNESQNYIMGFEFLSAQKGVLLQQTLQDTSIDSVIQGLDFTVSEGTEFFTVTLEDTIVYSMTVQSNGNILVVADNGVYLVNQKGEVTEGTSFYESMLAMDDNGGTVVLAFENLQDVGKTDLITLSADGTIANSTTIDGSLVDLYCDGDRIVVLTKSTVLELNYSFQLLNSYDNTRNYTKICRLNQDLYAMNSEYLYVVE